MTTQRTHASCGALLAIALAGCGGGMTTRFAHPDFNFSFVEKVAVLPFEDLASDRQAGARASRLFVTELLATGAIDVVEPGEVRAALTKVAGGAVTPSTEQIKALGQALGVQAVVVGAVSWSQDPRGGGSSAHVTIDAHMIETEAGATVWAAAVTEKGSGLGSKLLGTEGDSVARTTRACVRRLVRSLVRSR